MYLHLRGGHGELGGEGYIELQCLNSPWRQKQHGFHSIVKYRRHLQASVRKHELQCLNGPWRQKQHGPSIQTGLLM